MTKKAKRGLTGINFTLKDIDPLTENQRKAFESEKNLVLHGSAGTGKTFISMYLGFKEIRDGIYDKIVIIRSAVPTREMGFLPGREDEKARVYEEPYYNIVTDLFGRGDGYEYLKEKELVSFMTTSFIRGLTMDDSVIIVDECQNMSFHELDSIITRVGHNCRVIFCGDFLQSDLKEKEKNGVREFLQILNKMNLFDCIEFGINDIVRSKFVKDYLVAKHSL
jgi:phosphate starvation-inducible protein PhoH